MNPASYLRCAQRVEHMGKRIRHFRKQAEARGVIRNRQGGGGKKEREMEGRGGEGERGKEWGKGSLGMKVLRIGVFSAIRLQVVWRTVRRSLKRWVGVEDCEVQASGLRV
jgi:hypothetical protein